MLFHSVRTVPLVMLTLGAAAFATAAELPYHGHGHIMIHPSELQWGPVGSMAGDARIAVIEGDMGTQDPFTIRLRLPADYRVEPHTHPAYERVTVISGTFHFAHGEEFDRDGTTELPQGSFAVMAPGEPMFGYTEEETVLQLHGTGPWGIEYINPEDDPRKTISSVD